MRWKVSYPTVREATVELGNHLP